MTIKIPKCVTLPKPFRWTKTRKAIRTLLRSQGYEATYLQVRKIAIEGQAGNPHAASAAMAVADMTREVECTAYYLQEKGEPVAS